MKEIKFKNDTRGSLMLLCEMRMRRGYLRFTSRLQLVLVVTEPFVIETYIFSEGADLLQPHFLGERALYAEALVDNFPLKKHTHTDRYIQTREEPEHLQYLTGMSADDTLSHLMNNRF